MATTAPHPLGALLQQLSSAGGPGGGGLGGPMPGGPPGASAGGGPGLGRVAGMAGQPSPNGEAQAMKDAMQALGFAMGRYHLRAPEIARELATAMVHIRKAMDKSATLPQADVAPPPPMMPAGGVPGGLGEPGMPQLGG